MFNWLREYMELKMEMRERTKEIKVCESCETLKMQISIVNEQNKELINRLLHVPSTEPVMTEPTMPRIVTPSSHISFRVRQQMLEKEDRAAAKLLKQRENEVGKPTITTNELEEAMDLAATEREEKANG